MKKNILFLFLLLNCGIYSQKIRIGLFAEQKITSLKIILTSGNYLLVSDTSQENIFTSDTIDFKVSDNNQFSIYINQKLYSNKDRLELVQSNNLSFLDFTPIYPKLKTRSYNGDFEILVINGFIKIINNIEMDLYLKGVLESESGLGRPIEFYKVQSIISRTYALKYLAKHKKENYNLCDRVHCQVYLSKGKFDRLIDSAISTTTGIIMLDNNKILAPTFFHANCGGQTSETDLIWKEKIPFLKSIQDTFCTKTKQANWQKTIPLKKWTDFLVKKYKFPISDSISMQLMKNFNQPNRLSFYLDPIYKIPLNELRDEFKLKSTFFSAEIINENILLQGRGFGHGVGLCQEGAINMAKLGYKHEQILNHYFNGMYLNKY